MTWEIIGLAVIRVAIAVAVFFIARKITEYQYIDDRIYWMFFIGYIVGRVWSMIGQ